ncbi:hypothetical protein ASC63_00535 [Leifsonia sp. Root112D2]|nr:hypothetical protein ASC63_00535 [Leifsonia sp. Root112D2]
MVMIEGVALSRANISLDFYLTPNDPVYLAELQSHVVGMPNVRVNDPVPYDELIATLNDFDVGVFVLPPVNFNYEWALPNKLFDYVQARLGVVVGPSAEMSAYVRDFGLGEVAINYTAGAFARVLDALTLEQVHGFKRASDAAARDLSAEAQVTIWNQAIATIARKAV